MNEGAGVGVPLLVVAEEHLLLVQRAATEDIGFRHARGLRCLETGASVEVDGGGAVGGDGRHGGGEGGEDGTGRLLQGGAWEVWAEEGGVSTAVQEKVLITHV